MFNLPTLGVGIIELLGSKIGAMFGVIAVMKMCISMLGGGASSKKGKGSSGGSSTGLDRSEFEWHRAHGETNGMNYRTWKKYN